MLKCLNILTAVEIQACACVDLLIYSIHLFSESNVLSK